MGKSLLHQEILEIAEITGIDPSVLAAGVTTPVELNARLREIWEHDSFPDRLDASLAAPAAA